MGNLLKWCRGDNQPPIVEEPKKVSKITEADMVKSNLKKARDYIQRFIDRKEKQKAELSQEILRKYEKSKNKKELLPFLQTRKQLDEFIQSAETRVKIILRSIEDVEMQQTNLETIKVMQESNKFKQKIQDELEAMDWRGILEKAQEKYESPEFQTEQEDQDFQALWKQLGGDKMDEQKKVTASVVEMPSVAQVKEVVLEENKENKKELAYA